MIKKKNISFDQCLKCTVCTIYCPVARESHLYPGPKQSGPDCERLRIKNPSLVDTSLRYCNNCKRCEVVCPSDVATADMIQIAKWRYASKKHPRIRDFILSRTDLQGRFGTLFSMIANLILRLRITKFLMDIVLKIPFRRTFPRFERTTFRKAFRSIKQEECDKKLIYFHGCFVNYYDHPLGRDLVAVMNFLGYRVEIGNEKCCGVPLIANGYLNEAKRNARYNLKMLSRFRQDEYEHIISTSSSCSYAIKYEYPHLLEIDNSVVNDRFNYVTKFIYNQLINNDIQFHEVNIRIAYHAPCHLERFGGVMYTVEVLRMVPGLDLVLLDSECCGIAGTYGFKKEFYDIAQDIGSHLFQMIDQANPEYVVTDCETCKIQIEMGTKYTVLHPVNILAMAISGGS